MNTTKNNPIGIFDSGIGGTSIWKEIKKHLPNESSIYLADSRNAPYGQKTKNEIIELSVKNTEYLLKQSCKLIVVACNTATTNSIKYLRETYKIPFIGIEPAIKPASIKSITKNIGILATKGTLNSQLFSSTSKSISNEINIIEQIGEGLVELIESGKIQSEEMIILLKKHLSKFANNNIDNLVLGCTHYPYLIPQIQEILGKHVSIIDSGNAVARQTKRVLDKNHLLNNSNFTPIHQFYSNNNEKILREILNRNDVSINYLDF